MIFVMTLAVPAPMIAAAQVAGEVIVKDLAPGTFSYCPKDAACTRVDIVPWGEARVRE